MTKTKLYPMDSTMLESAGYDKENQLMAVRFKSDPTWLYIYQEVPLNIYQGMRKARHQGKYFHRNIRGKYPFRKVII